MESILQKFRGALLVSHDRAFIDNVVTELLVFESDQTIRPIVGGYSDYDLFTKRSRQPSGRPSNNLKPETGNPKPETGTRKPGKPRKFLNREQRELDELPARIREVRLGLTQRSHGGTEVINLRAPRGSV